MQFWLQTILITVLICLKPHSLQNILQSFQIIVNGVKLFNEISDMLTMPEEGYV